MTKGSERDPISGERPDEPSDDAAPNGLLWPFKRLWWFLEKHFLWPVADSFRRLANAMRHRSPIAYVGVTAMICVTVGAVAAALYFYNEANQSDPSPVVAEAPAAEDTVIAPAAPAADPGQASGGGGNKTGDEETLQGVVPDFDNSAESSNNGSGDDSGEKKKSGSKLPGTVVRPADPPGSPPLKVAHRFAETFVGYEIGEKKAARQMRRSTTGKLARELTSKPPRLPSNGRIPKATVLNVVKGNKKGRNMDVSVSLMRSGATSELRLGLTRSDGKRWLVSEVRG